MNSELPFIACLCPTFRRPSILLNNVVACFLNQTYPSNRRKLVVLDDSGELDESSKGENWSVISLNERYPSLPEKYHALVEMAGDDVDAYCIWEDDECFLPRHIEAHAMCLKTHAWSQPLFVYMSMEMGPILKISTGRFHSSIAFTRKAYEATGGWPLTKRPDFDLQLISNLQAMFGPPGNTCDFFGTTYVYRWASTMSYHGQDFMRNPQGQYIQNEDWWDLAASVTPQGYGRKIVPDLDQETRLLYSQLG